MLSGVCVVVAAAFAHSSLASCALQTHRPHMSTGAIVKLEAPAAAAADESMQPAQAEGAASAPHSSSGGDGVVKQEAGERKEAVAVASAAAAAATATAATGVGSALEDPSGSAAAAARAGLYPLHSSLAALVSPSAAAASASSASSSSSLSTSVARRLNSQSVPESSGSPLRSALR